jgi:hypothetical protein
VFSGEIAMSKKIVALSVFKKLRSSETTDSIYVSLTSTEAVEAGSLTEASLAVRSFITANDLGSSDFTGGDVYDLKTNMLIARISYNGRIWDIRGCEIC